MMNDKIESLVSQMTLKEKAGLCSGADVWHLKSVKRLGVVGKMVSDGPHGLRTQRAESDHLGINGSIKAVCFPAACATAASFDRELLYELGDTLGRECIAEGVSVLLGPAINIKRTPLCGRNFEYFSEDPYLSGELAKEYVKGVQKNGVGVSVKHFAANNQETDRMIVSADMDERTLREIYFPAFEKTVKKAKPYTVMCSYNAINGEYSSQNKRLLTDILRGEWGFDGYVMSDWGAVIDRVKALAAGLDLEMPGGDGETDKEIEEAVKSGALDEKILDRAVYRILSVSEKCVSDETAAKGMDLKRDHETAVRIAGECMVLLKNSDGVLPLKEKEKVVFIGEFAKNPRYQGGGSSHINAYRQTSAFETAAAYCDVSFEQGYDLSSEENSEELLKSAVNAAKRADKAVIFAGLPDSYESEGYDREHLRLPRSHDRLVEEVSKVQPNTVVVLHNGSPVEMPWADKVKGILEAYLGGEGVGEATADVLYGKVNPSGKLPETFPLKLSDNPSYLNFPGDGGRCAYKEGIYVGYRYYDKKEMPVLFPFGHGLSYTEFDYGDLRVEGDAEHGVTVRVKVKNTGKTFGKETVQIYIGHTGKVSTPVRQLKGFEKLALAPGEEKVAEFTLDKRAFSYYDVKAADWRTEGGEYAIEVGSSSRDIRLRQTVTLDSDAEYSPVTLDTTLGELYDNPKTRAFVEARIESLISKSNGGSGSVLGIAPERKTLLKLVSGVPLRGLISIMKLSKAQMQGIIDKLNGGFEK